MTPAEATPESTDDQPTREALANLVCSVPPWALPVEGQFRIGHHAYEAHEVIQALEPLLTIDRIERIERVLDQRTRQVATVVEGLANTGNVSAVMRTAEAFGFQPFHVVAGPDRFKTSARTSQGADKWLDTTVWADTASCVDALKSSGYRIVVTTLGPGARPIEDIDTSGQTAWCFGNEQDGASPGLIGVADELAVVHTPGFVESFNISVAAALCLHHVYRSRRREGRGQGDLTGRERAELKASFLLRSVKQADRVLERLSRPGPSKRIREGSGPH